MRADVVTAFFVTFLLVVVALVRGHDFDGKMIVGDLRNDIPEGERAAQVFAVAILGFSAKQDVEQGEHDRLLFLVQHRLALVALTPHERNGFVFAPAVSIAPFAGGEFSRRLVQYALDAGAGQVGQAVGIQEGKTVFQRVFITQAGRERGGGLGDELQGMSGWRAGEGGLLAGEQGGKMFLVAHGQGLGVLESVNLVLIFEFALLMIPASNAVVDIMGRP